MDSKPIIKIIKEATLITTKISNQDITIKTTLTMVSSKIITKEINISKFIKEINIICRGQIKIVTIIIKQTIPITKRLNHIIMLFLHLRILHKQWLLPNLVEPHIKPLSQNKELLHHLNKIRVKITNFLIRVWIYKHQALLQQWLRILSHGNLLHLIHLLFKDKQCQLMLSLSQCKHKQNHLFLTSKNDRKV